MKQLAFMLSGAGQCGIETAKTSLAEVHAVATMDRPQKYDLLDINEATLYCASTLHLHGLPFDYDAIRAVDPPDACLVCNTALADPLRPDPLHVRMFS